MTRMEESGSDLDEVLGSYRSISSMDFDKSSVEGETQLETYIQVQQVVKTWVLNEGDI